MLALGLFKPIFFITAGRRKRLKQIFNTPTIFDFVSQYTHGVAPASWAARHIGAGFLGRIACQDTRCVVRPKNPAPHRVYIDRKKENVILTPLYLSDTLSD